MNEIFIVNLISSRISQEERKTWVYFVFFVILGSFWRKSWDLHYHRLTSASLNGFQTYILTFKLQKWDPNWYLLWDNIFLATFIIIFKEIRGASWQGFCLCLGWFVMCLLSLYINQQDNLNNLKTKYIKNQNQNTLITLEIYQKYVWNMMGKNGNGERIQKHFCINPTIGFSQNCILQFIFCPTATYLYKINFRCDLNIYRI